MTAAPSQTSAAPAVERADPALLKALGAGEMYEEGGPVTMRETHASWVFLVGDRAYKVKKPLALGFLDYSTLPARQRACNEEVRVNRELAPGIYLGVRAIVKCAAGFCFASADSPDAVEYAVEMLRFDESDTLAGAIDAGTLTARQVQAVAGRLARFHRDARVALAGGADRVLASWQTNLAQLQGLDHDPCWSLDSLRVFGESFAARQRPEIDARVTAGLVRDGHGDLRCEHVLLGRLVRIVDRIEFDPGLRRIDVAADLAFPTMDLEARGHAWAARELVSAYRDAGGRAASDSLRAFYAAERALVRAKVCLIDAAESSAERRAAHDAQAETLWRLAERLCWRARRPLAIVLCGAPASGKSTLAEELSRRSELTIVSSDVVRKQLAGLPASARAGPEHYSDQFTRATYEQLAERGHARLRADGGVIVDATCHSPQQRALLLKRLDPESPCLTVHCRASPRTTMRRAAKRMHSEGRISDATPQIAARQLRAFQPPSELPSASVLSLDTEIPLRDQCSQVEAALDALLARRS
ncbi:MAG: bifunctional aminoglycoside phosphotransferase/ATP-binding protein [Solirubrobacteraceae bacterium]